MPQLGKLSLLITVIKSHLKNALAFYFVAVVFNSLIGIVLQARLLAIQEHEQQHQCNLSDETKQELHTEIIEILDLMLLTGQLFRAGGAIGICYNSIFAAANIVYCLPSVVTGLQVFEHVSGNGSVASLTGPEAESKRLSSRVNKILQDVIESNMNLLSIIIKRIDGLMELNQIESLDETKPSKGAEFSPGGNKFRTVAASEFLADLQHQLHHLIRLKSQKHKIWTINRKTSPAAGIETLATRFDLAFVATVWTFAQFVVYYAVRLSFDDIRSFEFGGRYQNITAMDCFSVINIYLSTYFCPTNACSSFKALLINIMEMLEQFNPIRTKLTELRTILHQMLQLDQNKHETKREYKLVKKDTYYECDKSAIELYVCYRIFRNEMQNSMKVAENILSQIVSMIIIIMIPTLPFSGYILKGNAIIFSTVMLFLICVANSSLLACGAINAYCLKHLKKMWYFIAFTERYNLDTFRSSQLANRPKFLKKRPKNFYYNFNYDFEYQLHGLDNCNFDFEYHLHGLATYHTMFLWRQLAREEELVQDHFVCKLFGIYEVNFRNIIKYNYWIVSITLVMLSGTLMKN